MSRPKRSGSGSDQGRHLTRAELSSFASWVGDRRGPLTETPVLHVYTLEQALEVFYSGESPWEDEATPPELAERQRLDFATVVDLLIHSLSLRDDEEVAPGIRRAELLRLAQRVKRRSSAYQALLVHHLENGGITEGRRRVRAGSRRKRR